MQTKRPDSKHRRFRILNPKGSPRTVKNAELDAVNTEYLAGRMPPEKAFGLVRELARRLEPRRTVGFLPENEAVAEAFYQARVAGKRGNVAPAEARRRVFWAVRKLGGTSLLGSSSETLYAALVGLNPGQKRRCAAVLNSILRWKGVEKSIQTERVTREEPEYVTLEEIGSFSLPRREWQLCVLAAFGTGARYGELFTLTPTSFRENGSHVFIGRQLKRSGNELVTTETKNRKTGTVFVIPEFRDAVKEWAAVATTLRAEMRRKGHPGEAFRLAAAIALKRDVTFHNLRHSYAKLMLSRGATLEDLRKWLRDRMSTVEDYYLSWVETSAEMQSSVRRFG